MNRYRVARLAGIVQIWILNPGFIILSSNAAIPEKEARSTSMFGTQAGRYQFLSLITYATGFLTYHVFSKIHVCKAVKKHNQIHRRLE